MPNETDEQIVKAKLPAFAQKFYSLYGGITKVRIIWFSTKTGIPIYLTDWKNSESDAWADARRRLEQEP